MHLLRYQFSHVNLAWSMFAASSLRTEVGNDVLQMVDLAAGSFAALVGMTFWNAELISRGQLPIRATVISAEPSEAMRVVGGTLWVRLHRTLNQVKQTNRAELEPFRKALNVTKHRQIPSIDGSTLTVDQEAHRCHVTMHAFYRDVKQQEAILQALHESWSLLDPQSGFVTCFHSHENWVRRNAPFKNAPKELTPTPQIPQSELRELRELGSSIGVERQGRHGSIHHTYPTWSNPLSDTTVLYWNS